MIISQPTAEQHFVIITTVIKLRNELFKVVVFRTDLGLCAGNMELLGDLEISVLD